MQAVAGQTHLQRRGGVYYFRRRVPKSLRQTFPFEAWTESLHTSDFEEAKKLARARSVEIDALIRTATAEANNTPSPPLQPDQASGLAAGWLADLLREDAELRLLRGDAWYRNQETMLEEQAFTVRCQLANGQWRAAGSLADRVLGKAGLFYGKEDASRRLMAAELLKARVAYHEALEARQRGEVIESPAAPPVTIRTSSGIPSGGTVADLIRDYTADKAKTHGDAWVTKRYGHIFKALQELLPQQKPVAALTRADGRAIRDFLGTIPQHAGKRYPGLSLREAVAAADRDGVDRLAPKTVASYLQNLNAMLNWAVAEGWLDRNPFSGLVGKAEAQTERRAYSAQELRDLFASLLPYRRTMPWKWWLPALGLYTGARLNELAQLRVEDLVEVDGVTCIRISPYTADGARSEDKRVKTQSSRRTVPLHDDLLSAGFADWVHTRGGPQDRIFHELAQDPTGGFSRAATRWFARQLEDAGLRTPGLVFHSLRHTFRDAARDGGVPEEVAYALGGWSSRAVAERYGSRGRIKPLKAGIDRLDFGGFNLRELSSR